MSLANFATDTATSFPPSCIYPVAVSLANFAADTATSLLCVAARLVEKIH